LDCQAQGDMSAGPVLQNR